MKTFQTNQLCCKVLDSTRSTTSGKASCSLLTALQGGSDMTNQDFINSYKSDEKIISDWYKIKDSKGKLVDLDGIISPLKIDNRQLMAPTDN